VPPTQRHLGVGNLASVSNWESLLERFIWKVKGQLAKNGLTRGIPSSQGYKTNQIFIDKHFGANQARGPIRIDIKCVPQTSDASLVIASAEVDDLSAQGYLKIKAPVSWEGSSIRSGLQPCGPPLAEGSDVTPGLGLKLSDIFEVETLPDLGLPKTIKMFDGVLKAMFAGSREDRNNAQTQAQTADTADCIFELVGALKARVVELGVVGQAVLPPVFDQAFKSEIRSDFGLRPGGFKSAVQRSGIQNVDINAAFDDEILNGIEQVDLGAQRGDIRKIPAGRRWGPARSEPAVKGAAALQNTVDCAQRWNGTGVKSSQQITVNGGSAELAQVADVFKKFASGENACFAKGIGAVGGSWRTRGLVRKIQSIQTLALGAANPALNGAERDMKAPRDGAHGMATANGRNDLQALAFARVFEGTRVVSKLGF
jgi:hypothetical protein